MPSRIALKQLFCLGRDEKVIELMTRRMVRRRSAPMP
jgi:hypothetical protein